MNSLVVDTVTAVSATVLTLVWASTLAPASGERRVDALAVLLICLVNLPLALRRRAPVVVLAVSTTTAAVYLAAGYSPLLNQLLLLLAVYTVAAHRPPLVSVIGTVITTGVLGYAQVLVRMGPVWLALMQSVVTTGVVWFVGNSTRLLAQGNRRLAVLTAQLAHEQEDRALRAVTTERVRIARELHDVVAHHMSVISVQAGVARYVLESDPATTGASLDTINDTSRRALEEMRHLLSVLRIPPERPEDDLDSYDPAPGLDRLDDLLARVRRAGVAVDLTVRGEPRPLTAGRDLCVYRIVQESLTNVLKHAQPACAAVELSYREHDILVRITDDGDAVPAPRQEGQGLIGMRERARLYGGTLAAGPGPAGGFAIELVLPLTDTE